MHRVLKSVAMVCCALVVVSFALFVRDQLVAGSKHQQDELVVAAAPAASPTAHRHVVGQPRRFIDGAAHTLTSPFDSIVASDSPWVNHSVPAIFGLLVYGLGLGYLARYASGRA